MVDQRSRATDAEGLSWLKAGWIQHARKRTSTYSVITAVLVLFFVVVLLLELLEDDISTFEVLLSAVLALAGIATALAVFVGGVKLSKWFGLGFVLLHAAVSVYYLGFSDERQNAVAAVQEMTVMAVYLAWFYGPRIGRILEAAILVAVCTAMLLGPFGGGAVEGDRTAGMFGVTNVLGVALLTWLCLEVGFFVRHRMMLEGHTDPLTGALNRRGFTVRVADEVRRARRSGAPLSVAVLDLDDFKAVNDGSGHEAGDAVLKSLVAQWSSLSRHTDVVARLGGDEFVMVLPHTSAADAKTMLHRMRKLASHPWSWGVTEVQSDDTIESVLRRADAEMYRAKRGF